MGFVRCMGMSEDDIDEYLQPTVNLGTLPNQTKSYSYPSVSGKKGLKGITFNTQAVTPATLQSKSVTLTSVSQTITPDSGYNGMSSVSTSVPLQGKGNTTVPIEVSSKMSIKPDSGYLGLSEVWVTPSGGSADPTSVYNRTHLSLPTTSQNSKSSEDGDTNSITCPGDGWVYWSTYPSDGITSKDGNGRARLKIFRSGTAYYDAAIRFNESSDWPQGSGYQKLGGTVITVSHEFVPVKKNDIVHVYVATVGSSGKATLNIYALFIGNAS